MDIVPPILAHAPPLDPAWLAYEATTNELATPSQTVNIDPLARQTQYAAACRSRNNALLAPGARDHHLSLGISTITLSIPSTKDGHAIPILQYTRTLTTTVDNQEQPPQCVIIYFHGGGLTVGEPDSEDLSCRRLVLSSPGSARTTLYSVGYRLKPQHPAQTSLDDSIDAFTALAKPHPATTKIILVGSSSGGQLAALVSQHALHSAITIHGVLLRCPVTSDSFGGFVPAGFRCEHTSAEHASFATVLLQRLDMDGPRDGLARMPLEAEESEVEDMPRTWVQLCTNDVLYSDGACYARLLREAGVVVGVDVVEGWPHTFWLKAPHLARALEAEESLVEGLCWVLG